MGIKYEVNENFFETWSKKSAYVLGFLFADGSLENASYIRGKYIRFSNTDLCLLEKIKYSLGSFHKIIVIPASANRKEKYLLRIGSHKIYDDLEKFGLWPNKSLTMRFPNVPEFLLSDFIRGYFDGDGTIAIERIKNRPHDRLAVVFTSGSKEFLVSLMRILKRTSGVDEKKIYNSRRSYQLLYRSKDAIKVLDFIYSGALEENSLCLERKRNKYIQLLSSPDKARCGNLFDKRSKLWNYGAKRRRTQAA